jgi:hypothetical protein
VADCAAVALLARVAEAVGVLVQLLRLAPAHLLVELHQLHYWLLHFDF